MPKGPESKIEKELRLYMESEGGFFPKTVSPGNNGWPDRNPCHPNCGPFYMEIKRPGAKATPLQIETAKKMSVFGYRVYLNVDQFRKGKEIIDDEIKNVPSEYKRHKPV